MSAAAAVLASPVSAAPAADSAPASEGPLLQQGEPVCDERTVISRQEVVADLHACLWWFAYLPLLETDVERDHGALWFQTTVTPRRGWCLRRLAGSVYSSPETTRMSSFVVGGRGDEARPRIDVDAEGAALQEASLSQTVGGARGRVSTRADLAGGYVDFTWTGNARSRVEAVVGAEISWEAATSAADVFEFGRLLNPVLRECAPRR